MKILATYAWLKRIYQKNHSQQAYKFSKLNGETMFNEAAFDQGKALYDGELFEV